MSNEHISENKLIDLYYFAIGDGNFIKAMEKYCSKQGFGNEHIWCLFAGELEEWEEGYFGEDGVCYFFDYPAVDEDQTIVLDYPTFYYYLKEASTDYLIRHPNAKDEVEARLEEIKQKVNVK
ncbi:ribonuclease toxin immunity protein CdiI [Paenibacillus sp. chi10]|uniref:Ribonuclease toxin immunity protein CdiI n=1 Tax=Paenibacillus suaedae TaxID=3077233 RepID=A0AAJ2N765_9BACL|nr:ribonuclease toxin immunity protein CdiI [Paenibacillus sp. chi10]MDT8979320.1 ribonuclease toxin immunity protein CdiI [Paenibacillus sp. chi10]